MFELSPKKALIFRITHIDNVPWALDNGLHCANSRCLDPNFRTIGHPELIGKRNRWPVSEPPGGVLSDYVAFYFTPWSVMLYNIKTGFNVPMVPMPEIAFFVTSLHKVKEDGLRFLFTDCHANAKPARLYSDLQHLDCIDWEVLRSRNFRKDLDDPGRCDRYMAEALIHRHVPVASLLGIACYGRDQEERLKTEVRQRSLATPVVTRREWYFS